MAERIDLKLGGNKMLTEKEKMRLKLINCYEILDTYIDMHPTVSKSDFMELATIIKNLISIEKKYKLN